MRDARYGLRGVAINDTKGNPICCCECGCEKPRPPHWDRCQDCVSVRGPHQTPSPDSATEPSTLRHRLGPPLSVLDEVRAQHHRQDVATPDDEVWTSCAICYMLGEGWPCTVARLVAVCDEQIESEARAASVKGEPASAQAVAPGLDVERMTRAYRAAINADGPLNWDTDEVAAQRLAAAYAATDAKEAGA